MIIHAVSIHSGGGKVLLDYLLAEQIFGPITHLICDQRYELPINLNLNLTIQVKKIKPKIIQRWKAEIILKKIADRNTKEEILCFSNLPPAFKVKNKVILYLQNALLLPGIPLYVNSIKAWLRILYEKAWLNIFWQNIDEVWVQTAWMKEKLIHKKKTVLLRPFLPKFPIATKTEIEYDYISITGSAPHKRLLELLNAWDELNVPCPKLLIIMDTPTTAIKKKLKTLKNKNVQVKVNISRDELFSIYPKCRCLIVTSKVESFCLPLYEAMHFGLQVFAIEEAFNKDILNNENFLNIKQGKIVLDQMIRREL